MSNERSPFLRGLFFFGLGGMMAALVIVPLFAATLHIFPTITFVWGCFCAVLVIAGLIFGWHKR